MLAYIIRRLFYAIPILIGVNLLTFTLFFVVNSPDDMAVSQLGEKYVTPEAIEKWKVKNGYDKPLFVNDEASGIDAITDTIFFNKSLRLFAFDFGRSESGRDITTDVSNRMWPSLAVALPTFAVGIGVNICVALMVVMFHGTKLDRWAVFVFVSLMSISYLFYIIGGQYLIAKTWKLVPVSGFHPDGQVWRFLILPVMVGVVAGIGSGARWYRTLFLEEANQDYVRTARDKGASEISILLNHLVNVFSDQTCIFSLFVGVSVKFLNAVGELVTCLFVKTSNSNSGSQFAIVWVNHVQVGSCFSNQAIKL